MTFAFSNYTNNEIEYIAKHLDSKATRSGFGWLTRCPAHQTKEGGNLSIRLGDNGKLLINCFTGCNFLHVVKQLTPTDTAGCPLATGFIDRELKVEFGDVNHTVIFVHDNHATRTHN